MSKKLPQNQTFVEPPRGKATPPYQRPSLRLKIKLLYLENPFYDLKYETTSVHCEISDGLYKSILIAVHYIW